MTDSDIIAAIRKRHLKANIDVYERMEQAGVTDLLWHSARVDPEETSFFGPGPYLKLPIEFDDGDQIVIRVYAPARLRRKLAAQWDRATSRHAPACR